MSSSMSDQLRNLPSVDAILRHIGPIWQTSAVPRRVVLQAVRAAVDQTRKLVAAGHDLPSDKESLRREIVDQVHRQLRTAASPHYRKVINATGIILHTALGRAVLPASALRQIQAELTGYSLVQVDTDTGKRSKRDERIEWLLQQLTGAEAATVVNNNAAATVVVLNTAAAGREVIVSRGQLVEIGGSFRLPDVMAVAGVKLVEVGTTNKTHLRDYQQAITENTAAILRVHPSNYKISGFTAEVPLAPLVQLGHQYGLVVIDDVGAGPLVDFAQFGFEPEPTLPESVRAGADLITSSADKLIGGPQGGLILGRAPLIQAVRKNPLVRILRPGKLTLAALEATLALFLDDQRALSEVPTLQLLRRSLAELDQQAHRIAQAVAARVPQAHVHVADGCSQMGSGSLPTQDLPTRLIRVTAARRSPSELARRLRQLNPPVFVRIHKGQLLLDPRTLLEGEESVLTESLVTVLTEGEENT
jgi:L-seryl-tRNA(Ser) seleniumtransferase